MKNGRLTGRQITVGMPGWPCSLEERPQEAETEARSRTPLRTRAGKS